MKIDNFLSRSPGQIPMREMDAQYILNTSDVLRLMQGFWPLSPSLAVLAGVQSEGAEFAFQRQEEQGETINHET